MRAILAYFRTTVGMVVGIVLAVALVIGVVKFNWTRDRVHAAWYGEKNTSATAHEGNAADSVKAADSAAALAARANSDLEALLVTPEIRRNPGAQRVGKTAKTVIAAKNTEIGALRGAVAEEKKAVKDIRAAGEKPTPRITGYIDAGYAVSLTRKYGLPVARIGAVYHVFGWVNVQGELSYEPPPSISQARQDALDKINERDFAKPEIRATVTAHFKF